MPPDGRLTLSQRVGRISAKAFAAAGWRIKRFQRGTDMTRDAMEAQVIVNGMNPANYRNWAKHLPHITRQHIAAAKASGALEDLPSFADIPFAGHSFSVADLQRVVADELGSPVRIKPFPWWLMRLAAPVWTLAREMRAMRYLYSLDHSLADGTARLLPNLRRAPLAEVMRRKLSAGLKRQVNPDNCLLYTSDAADD